MSPLRRALVLMAVIGSPASWAQDTPELPEGWTLHAIGMGIETVSCAANRAALRSRTGDVKIFDGESFESLPPALPSTGRSRQGRGSFIAAGPGGQVVMDLAEELQRWDGESWHRLEMEDWSGQIRDLEFLDSGELVVLGEARIGVLEDRRLTSYAAASWLDMGAMDGSSIVDLWSVGHGGGVYHHTMEGWSRVEGIAERFLAGVYRCGPDCLWVWDGQGEGWLGGSHDKIWRYEDGSWVDRSAPERVHRPSISGGGDRPWMFSSQAVHRFNGEAWEPVLSVEMLGQDQYYSFAGGCVTDSAVVVGESQGKVLVLKR